MITGCTKDVVIVHSDSDLLMLAKDVKGHVYYRSGTNWVRSANKVLLPEGWIAGPAHIK